MKPMIRTDLYRWYGEDGALLYVGISHDPVKRARHHKLRSRWFHLAVEMKTEEYPNRMDAMQAEMAAIENEKPKFNIEHSQITFDAANLPESYVQDMAKWTVNLFGEFVESDGARVFNKYDKPMIEDYV